MNLYEKKTNLHGLKLKDCFYLLTLAKFKLSFDLSIMKKKYKINKEKKAMRTK
jgi:hypothetical protein